MKQNFTIITILLSALIVLSCGTQGRSHSAGNANAPLQVYNAATLKKVGTGADGWTLSARYEQTADIDMTGQTFTAIGSGVGGFMGSYDGQNYRITGLTISSSGSHQGMFGMTGIGARVENLVLENVNISGMDYTGGVTGYNAGTISNCFVQGIFASGSDSESDFGCVGGITGFNNGTVEYCFASVNVSGGGYVGGLAGRNDGMVRNSHSEGSVKGVYHVGGLVGHSQGGVIERSFSSANVTGHDDVGGLAGEIDSESRVMDCYATGNVSGNNRIGGLIGDVWGSAGNSYASGSVHGNNSAGGVTGNLFGRIFNCIALNPSVTAAVSNAGEIAGNITGSIDNCRAFIGAGQSGEIESWWKSSNFSESIWNVEGVYPPTLKNAGPSANR